MFEYDFSNSSVIYQLEMLMKIVTVTVVLRCDVIKVLTIYSFVRSFKY